MDIQSTVTTVKDVVVAISALIGAGVAFAGLSTWNRQIKGQASYELARRLLRNTYRLRDALLETNDVLTMALSSNDVAKYTHKNIITSSSTGHFKFDQYRNSEVFSDDPSLESETDFLEAEVLWGIDISNDFNFLAMMKREIRYDFGWIEETFDKVHKKVELEMSEQDQLLRCFEKYNMYSLDEYKTKLNIAVTKAESQVKKHLNRI